MWVATILYTAYCCIIAISTHTTHVGGDQTEAHTKAQQKTFQLTPPMWVATLAYLVIVYIAIYISTHTTHKGGDCDEFTLVQSPVISTHATHKGGDNHQLD